MFYLIWHRFPFIASYGTASAPEEKGASINPPTPQKKCKGRKQKKCRGLINRLSKIAMKSSQNLQVLVSFFILYFVIILISSVLKHELFFANYIFTFKFTLEN